MSGKVETVWAVYNKNTQVIESSGFSSEEDAEAHVTYLVVRGIPTEFLSVVEVPR